MTCLNRKALQNKQSSTFESRTCWIIDIEWLHSPYLCYSLCTPRLGTEIVSSYFTPKLCHYKYGHLFTCKYSTRLPSNYRVPAVPFLGPYCTPFNRTFERGTISMKGSSPMLKTLLFKQGDLWQGRTGRSRSNHFGTCNFEANLIYTNNPQMNYIFGKPKPYYSTLNDYASNQFVELVLLSKIPVAYDATDRNNLWSLLSTSTNYRNRTGHCYNFSIFLVGILRWLKTVR